MRREILTILTMRPDRNPAAGGMNPPGKACGTGMGRLFSSLCLVATLAVAGCGGTVDQSANEGPARPLPGTAAPAAGDVSSGSGTAGGDVGTGALSRVLSTFSGTIASRPPASGQPAARGQASRIAILLPLSGRGAALGTAILDAAQLALFEVGGEDLELLVFDTKGAPASAEAAARQAVADGARLILGPLFSESTGAVGAIASAADVSVVSFSNDIKVAGDGVYVFGFLPGQQIHRIVSFAAQQGYGALGLLLPDSGFGDLASDEAQLAAAGAGLSVARIATYDPNQSDLAPLVSEFADYGRRKRALQAQKSLLAGRSDAVSKQALARVSRADTFGDPPYDAVLVPAGGDELAKIAPLLAYYDVDPARVRFLGSMQWEEARSVGVEPALVGGWYAGAPIAGREVFADKFERAFAARPPRLASLGYDAMLLAIALTYGEGGPRYDAVALTNESGFVGAAGIFRLTPEGANQRGLAVFEVRDRAVKMIDPAPDRFQARLRSFDQDQEFRP